MQSSQGHAPSLLLPLGNVLTRCLRLPPPPRLPDAAPLFEAARPAPQAAIATLDGADTGTLDLTGTRVFETPLPQGLGLRLRSAETVQEQEPRSRMR